jgi:PAS domain S-box-containing protein
MLIKLEEALSSLKYGEHLCCIYRTKEEQQSIVVPFMIQGLKRNEKCLYIVDENTKEEIIEIFRKFIDIDRYLLSGQFEILTKDEAYLKDGYFDPDRMIALLKEVELKAIEEGYTGLRATGEMTWVFAKLPGVEKLIEYEAKLNYHFPGSRCLAICQYNESKFDPGILIDVILTHPKLIIYDSVCDNPYYIPPEIFLGGVKKELFEDIYIKLKGELVERAKRETHLRRLVGEVEKREKKYREIVDLLQRLIDVAPVAVTAWDTEFRITLWNKAAEALFGWKADEAVGKDLFELQVPEKERSRVRSVIEEVMRTGVSKTNVNENFTKDGRKLLVEWYNFAIRDADGRIVGGGSIGIDLTKRIEMERKLRESEEKFRKIVENSPNLIFIVDRGGVFVDANPATIQFFGFSPVGRNLEDVLPGDAKKRVNLVRQVVDNEKTFTVRDTVNGKHFEASFIPIELSDGRYCLVIAKDITEILRLNRLLSVIKNVDMIIVREKNKRKLLQKACKELSSVEDYATVTILLVEAKKIRPVAISGVKRNFESVFLKTLQDCEVVRKCVDGEVLAGEVEELCPKCEFAREFRRVMAFPMIVNGDVREQL